MVQEYDLEMLRELKNVCHLDDTNMAMTLPTVETDIRVTFSIQIQKIVRQE